MHVVRVKKLVESTTIKFIWPKEIPENLYIT